MTTYFQQQMQHDPTKDYYDWLINITDIFSPVDILEVGAAWGVSTHAFLSNMPSCKLTTVDKNHCQPAHDEAADLGAQDRWTFIERDSKTVLPELLQQKKQFDLVYIDGDHSLQGAATDLTNGWELVKPGGYMLIDDVLHKSNGDPATDFNVARALWSFIHPRKLTAVIYPSWTGFALIQKPI